MVFGKDSTAPRKSPNFLFHKQLELSRGALHPFVFVCDGAPLDFDFGIVFHKFVGLAEPSEVLEGHFIPEDPGSPEIYATEIMVLDKGT